MKPQIITRDGEPEYAVVPYEQYRQLLEDAEMLADIRAFDAVQHDLATGQEEMIPIEVVDRLLEGENPFRVWREYRAVSAVDLAKSCGVTAAAISQVESGRRQCSLGLLRKIGKALNVDLDSLAGGKV